MRFRRIHLNAEEEFVQDKVAWLASHETTQFSICDQGWQH